MSHEERTGVRSLLYSGWHRPRSTRRYVGAVTAAKLCMIDIDACEYCCMCGEPLALIETQVSTAPPKRARVTERLSTLADIPAYSVSIEEQDAEPVLFRVQQRIPTLSSVRDLTPREYAQFLWSLRDHHVCALGVVR